MMVRKEKSIPVLDGWRGISILLVLATHMLPLGPGGWGNAFFGVMGMSLFFTLSGFLIVSTLLERPNVLHFFIRRGCRILPLAIAYAALALAMQGKELSYYLSHFLFLINYDHAHITGVTSHFWSLCVEVHFYIFVGLLVLLLGRRGLFLLPLLCLAITGIRIAEGSHINIKTHLRVDEILSGACLALVYHGQMAGRLKPILARIWQPGLIVVLLLTCYPGLEPLHYFRPYAAAILVASTVFAAPNRLSALLSCRFLRYIAAVSYALYVIHKLTMFGWLGTGSTMERYLIKRPISFALTFAAAHLSTFYYERWWVDLGKRLTGGRRPVVEVSQEPGMVAAEIGLRKTEPAIAAAAEEAPRS